MNRFRNEEEMWQLERDEPEFWHHFGLVGRPDLMEDDLTLQVE